MITIAAAIVRNNKAYLAVMAQIEAGPYLDIEPVFTADLTVNSLTSAFEKVIAAGHPKIPTPTKEEMKEREDPILKAARVSSWKQLARGGASYTIEWTKDTILLYISRLDRRGRFEVDPVKTQTFTRDTHLRTIVSAILEDARSRPELLGDFL
jgi:hypothetical protein